MKNIAIIYHDADFDGKLSNEVCRYHLARLYPEAAIHSYGWDYGRPVPSALIKWWDPQMGDQFSNEWGDYDAIYIVDLSVDELMARPELRTKIVWIDHHKSAIEKWDKGEAVDGECHPDNPVATRAQFIGCRIDGVAACRLCWQWFSADHGPHGDPRNHPCDVWVPPKQAYINRTVAEPELIRLAGEYDIWDQRDADAKILQFGLRAVTSERLKELIDDEFGKSTDGRKSDALWKTLTQGRAIKAYMDKQNKEYAAEMSGDVIWEGLVFLAINSSHRNSDAFLGAIKDHHDALLNWRFDPKSKLATVSLYHAPGKEHHDLSLIAVKYGGGGHKGACGFRMDLAKLSEILNNL